jgi:hypothetical protein
MTPSSLPRPILGGRAGLSRNTAAPACYAPRSMAGRVRCTGLVRVCAVLSAATLIQMPPSGLVALAAQKPSVNDVLERVTAYVTRYNASLADIVAEERYRQWAHTEPGVAVAPGIGVTSRLIRSDIVITQLGDEDSWVALRDAFEVDGAAVRDRENRLAALLSRGGEQSWRRAAAIANESARFNVGNRVVARNINVPTFALQLLHGPNRARFRFSLRTEKRRDAVVVGGTAVAAEERVELEFRERERPTIVRQQSGGDQPLRGTILVDPQSGEVWQTHLTWERGPSGFIDVTFGRAPEVDILVPLRMLEAYSAGPTTINGDATYSNFRRFVTSSRVVEPGPEP